MVFPRSGLATKGIVPCDLIKARFNFKIIFTSGFNERFFSRNILNAKVTSSAYFFFAYMKDYITTFILTTSLWEMNENLMV